MSVPMWETRTRSAILALCDYLTEEADGELAGDITRLTMVQHWAKPNDPDAQTIIRMLQKKLGVEQKKVKQVRLSPEQYSEIRRARRTRRNDIEVFQYYLEKPFGMYYEKLTVPFVLLNTKEVVDDWMENPIDDVTIVNIPENVIALDLRSERLTRCTRVAFHFNATETPFTTFLNILKGMKLSEVKVIEVRGMRVSPALVNAALIQLKPHFTNLETIDVGQPKV